MNSEDRDDEICILRDDIRNIKYRLPWMCIKKRKRAKRALTGKINRLIKLKEMRRNEQERPNA